jgi:hypothetical protein
MFMIGSRTGEHEVYREFSAGRNRLRHIDVSAMEPGAELAAGFILAEKPAAGKVT